MNVKFLNIRYTGTPIPGSLVIFKSMAFVILFTIPLILRNEKAHDPFQKKAPLTFFASQISAVLMITANFVSLRGTTRSHSVGNSFC